MDEGLKKRLLGAAVLASLAVIFVPMLIEEPEEAGVDIGDIPAPPDRSFTSDLLREEVPAPRPVPIDISGRESEPEPEPEPEPPTDTPAPAEPAAPAQAQTPPAAEPATPRAGLTAWMVQVGSFSNQENADQLVDKLRKAGFQTPDPEQVQIRGKSLYRVRVGPMVDKDKAERLLPEINSISGTKGLVSRFQ